jgi:hypothetical protein
MIGASHRKPPACCSTGATMNLPGFRPFFCQVEAVETAIWLTEVAPQMGKREKSFLDDLANANKEANPELMRLALKLATGAGKTTVMAMLIAWQTDQCRAQAQQQEVHPGISGRHSRHHHPRPACGC